MSRRSIIQSHSKRSIDPNQLMGKAISHHQKGEFDDAKKIYELILKNYPKHFDALQLLATVLAQKKMFQEAIQCFRKTIAINPNSAHVYNNLANALKNVNLLDEALENYNKAIQLKSDYVEAYNNRGSILRELRRLDEALENYDKAIQLKPDYAQAYTNRGNTLKLLFRVTEALENYDKAIQLKPDYAEAYYNRGNSLLTLKRLDEASISYEKALHHNPITDYLLGTYVHNQMHLCNWVDYKKRLNQLIDKTQNKEKICTPFSLLALTDDPLIHLQSARIYGGDRHPLKNSLEEIRKYSQHKKIRLGYFSADFLDHATMHLILELFKYHNRESFELFAFSYGPVVEDNWRDKAKSYFDQFLDVNDKSDMEIAMISRDLEIDIAIDLKGFTTDSRPGIFSYRAAPIQMNYLGYPGTMGADYYDYIVADNILIPADLQNYYSEKIVYLPNSYQVNMQERVISNKTFTREQMGLPEDAFVFCSFNNNYKITPETFDSWMRILKSVKGSVFWIFTNNNTAMHNLKSEAEARGIDSNRLVFSSSIPVEEHLKRIQLADLFLDTFPCNAHTTTSDALRVGLPILTLTGRSFASRVAASLLNAVNLPELITKTRAEYELLAIELASDTKKLKALKNKLVKNLSTSTLYDSLLFTNHIESAYKAIYQRYHDDLNPDNIYLNC